MKKKLEADLISIAHKILQLKNTSSITELKELSRQLHENFTILEYLEAQKSTELQASSAPIPPTKVEAQQEPTITEEVTATKDSERKHLEKQDDRPEIIIEEINAKVTEDIFVPASEKQSESTMIGGQPSFFKNDKEEVTPSTLDIEKAKLIGSQEEKPKSLNDRLKKGIQIGLNDRLAFIKHLFEGNPNDYNRVISQLNTIDTKEEAGAFIRQMVKPDYNWQGKEEYEKRFTTLVIRKFDK
ncbi:hypothetical protein [Aquimarina brevivitae]|uniref:Uncharacterized protein n=1 Tax=Aquimarina brevivitae TaxID=323412 RepID=A0A4Q7PI72_9FLAO|nr:hypothetical protein [Aquimarina brevivitae]RZS99510.1 hypothetical protein EV197_0730 [Aquimarina brevivitae]